MGISKVLDNPVGLESVGAAISGLQRQVDTLTQGATDLTAVQVTIPEPRSPFLLTTRPDKKKKFCYGTFALNLPAGAEWVRMLFQDQSLLSDRDAILGADDNIDLTELAPDFGGGPIDVESPVRLAWNTTYGLVRLVVGGGDLNKKIRNPGTLADPYVYLTTFTTPEAVGAPGAPAANLILQNALDSKTRAHDCFVELAIPAPLTDAGAVQTWAAWLASTAGADTAQASVVAIVHRTDVTPNVKVTELAPYTIRSTDTETSALTVPPNRGIVRILGQGLRVGATYGWGPNRLWVGEEPRESGGSVVTFIGGNLSTDPTTLTAVSLQLVNSEPFDDKFKFANLLLTQPAAVVALKNLTVRRKLQSEPDANYVTVIKKFPLQDDEWHTAGAKIIPVKMIKLKPTKAYTLQIQITAIGGAQLIVTQNVGTGTEPDVPADTAVPGNLGTPDLRFHKGLVISNMTVGSQWAQGQKKYISVSSSNSGFGPWFDFQTYFTSESATAQTTANETAARWEVGPGKDHTTLGVQLAALIAALGSSSTVYVRFTAENLIGPTQSLFSNGRPVTALKDNTNRNEAVNVVDVGVNLYTPNNLLKNGDFLMDSGVAGTLGKGWQRWNLTFPVSGGVSDITTATTTSIYWDQTNDSLVWPSNVWALAFNMKKRLKPGEDFSFSFLAKSLATHSPILTMRLFRGDAVAFSDVSGVIGTSFALSPADYVFCGVQWRYGLPAATYDTTAEYWLVLLSSSPLDSVNNVILDRLMLVRGKQPVPYAPRAETYEQNGSGANENADATSTVKPFISSPDLGRPAGITQGGWTSSGSGTIITIGTL